MSEILSDFFIEKAKKELNETESRKKQSYEIMKSWALRHPYIRFKEDILTQQYLMQYLRTRKYTMEKAYESYEKTLTTVKRKENWFNFYGEGMKKALELYDTGYMIVSKERDSCGRRAVICSHKVDATKFDSDDVFRLTCLVFSYLCNEPESQISGAIYINNGENVTMNYIALLTLKNFYEASLSVVSCPVRMKKILVVGLPIVAHQLYNVAKAALSEKMTKRLMVVDSIADLPKHIDVSILPKEYGGNYTTEELLQDFKPKMIQSAEYINQFHSNLEIDFHKADKGKGFYKNESHGSFRKLEID